MVYLDKQACSAKTFNRYDADFFPSVPHGHLKTKSRIKLDLYRGTYNMSQRNNPMMTRETRDFLAGLWRDDGFRYLAIDTLRYFDQRHKGFEWFKQRGIHRRDPFHLPRKY